VGRGDLDPDPGLALGNHRKAEPDHVDTFAYENIIIVLI
jgi:hypothetical protein